MRTAQIPSEPSATVGDVDGATITLPMALQKLLARNPAGVGASTGFMSSLWGNWEAMIAEARAVSPRAVELSALSGWELPELLVFLTTADAPLDFAAVSVHGPAKGWDLGPEALAGVLAELPHEVAGVVMHPETLADCDAYSSLGARLWLENMDTRKLDARTVPELERYFRLLPDARFCFDIAHAWLHDPSMKLAHDLLDAFGDRLAEVHLSSIEPSGRHVPLTVRDAEVFGPVLDRCLGVPWILEAPLASR